MLYGAMLQFQRSLGVFPEMENEADPCTDAKAVTPQVTIEDHACTRAGAAHHTRFAWLYQPHFGG